MSHRVSRESLTDMSDFEEEQTFPRQASALRKGDYVLLKNQPCKLVEYNTSKPGKHGSAKVVFVGFEIFTGKKVYDMSSSTHDMYCPNVEKKDYQLTEIKEDGYYSLLDLKTNKKREDMRIKNEELKENVESAFQESDNGIMVTVIKAMGKEEITGFKKMPKRR